MNRQKCPQEVALTPLAEWLEKAMREWKDPVTQKRGLSQNRLRNETGLSQASIWEILKKGHIPKPEALVTLARFFGVSPSWLFGLAYAPDEPSLSLRVQSKFIMMSQRVFSLPEDQQGPALDYLHDQLGMYTKHNFVRENQRDGDD